MLFKTTIDHDEIRTWVEEHGGKPSIREKKGTQRGVIDITFSEYNEIHEVVTWEEFFDTFDALAMEFRYDMSGEESKQFSYSILYHSDEPNDTDVGLENELEMPEDDIPIENVVPSAPATGSPDSLNNRMMYT
jgi:hypothetical protein